MGLFSSLFPGYSHVYCRDALVFNAYLIKPSICIFTYKTYVCMYIFGSVLKQSSQTLDPQFDSNLDIDYANNAMSTFSPSGLTSTLLCMLSSSLPAAHEIKAQPSWYGVGSPSPRACVDHHCTCTDLEVHRKEICISH